MKSVLFFIITFLICTTSYADDTEPIDTITIDTIPPALLDSTISDSSHFVADSADTLIPTPPKDTIIFLQSNTMDLYTPVNDTTNYENKLYQNPTKALFKSMLIPGWGQYGNKKYYKAVMFVVLDIWLISNAVKYGGEANDYFKLYESETTTAGRNEYYRQYENKKDSRNKYTWFAVIVSFISMFDAYVDAHLSGFPDKNRFSDFDVDVQYDPRSGIKAAVSLPFNP